MKITHYVSTASFAAVAAATLAACNSGSSGPAPAPVSTPSTSNSVPAAGGTITSTLLNGAVATITLPAASAPFTVSEVPSTTPPAALGIAATGTPVLYESITPAASVNYAPGAVVTGTYASATPLSGTYVLELYSPGLGWLVGPPVTASGNIVNFSYTLPQQIPLLGGVTYFVAIAHT